MEMALLLSIPCRFNTPCTSLSSLYLSPSPFSSSSSSVQLSTISSSLPRPPCTKRTTLSPSPCLPTLTHNRNSNQPNSDTDTDQQKPPWMRLVLCYVRRLVRLFHGLSLRKRMALFGLLVLSGGALTLLLLRRSFRASKVVPYSDLVNGVRLGRVAAVDFEEGSRSIYFQTIGMQKSENSSLGTKRLRTRKMDRDEKFLLGLLREHGVTYRSVPPPVSRLLLSCIGTIAGLWVGVIPLIWIMERRLHGDAKKKNRTGTRQLVSFDDVQGVDSAKEELIEVVNCLQGTLDYKKLGAKLPTGILLVGPPGTGKTLLARAVASEADVPFFSVSASEFVELYVGRGAARVRDLFKEARREAPAVVFIDELDAVGTERDGFSAERDQTLNQLLTEMDGFDSDKQVIVLAATNRPDALDSALLRPGRFSRKVVVGEPDFEGRKRILAVHLRRVPLEEEMEVVCDLVANLTEGFVGADLANIANEAALLAVRRGGSLVTREDIMEAIEREKFGVNENKGNAAAGSKRLEKLFPWLPSLAQGSLKSKNRDRNAIGSRRVLSH